jgi:hypothetical protein
MTTAQTAQYALIKPITQRYIRLRCNIRYLPPYYDAYRNTDSGNVKRKGSVICHLEKYLRLIYNPKISLAKCLLCNSQATANAVT